MVRDEQPEKPATWVKLSTQDHYFHALASVYIGIKIKELERYKNDDEIRTQVTSQVISINVHSKDIYGRQIKSLALRPFG